MYPVDSLLDRKLSSYIVTPHGDTTVGDANTFTVGKNLHVFCMAFRRKTYFTDPLRRGDHFNGIKDILYLYKDSKYSINQIIDKIMSESYLTEDAKSGFAYYPPGSTIRNLKLTRDYNRISNVDGVFKIGTPQMLGVIKPNRIGEIDKITGCPIIPLAARARPDIDPTDNSGSGAEMAIKVAVKRWDLDNPDPAFSLEKFPRKWLQYNNLQSAFNIVNQDGERDEEEKIILVLSCAGATPGPPEYSNNEKMFTAQNLLESTFRSDANPDKLCAVLFKNPNYKKDICYLLENNLRFNERLHFGIEKPLPILNPEDTNRYLYRSKVAFNKLLTKVPGRIGGAKSEYIVIKDNDINYCTKDGLKAITFPFTLIKIPDGYNKFLFSREINFIQFFKSFPEESKAEREATLAAVGTEEIVPIGMLQVPHIVANPACIAEIMAEHPVAAGPVGHIQLLNEYSKKYLKYKQKYIVLKAQSNFV